MYYIAIVKGEEIRHAEHYKERIGLDRRMPGLRLQAMIEGEGYSLYVAEEPYECYLVRISTLPKDGEEKEDYEIRLAVALQPALKNTISKLTPTMIDDVPHWYREGYSSQEDFDINSPKVDGTGKVS